MGPNPPPTAYIYISLYLYLYLYLYLSRKVGFRPPGQKGKSTKTKRCRPSPETGTKPKIGKWLKTSVCVALFHFCRLSDFRPEAWNLFCSRPTGSQYKCHYPRFHAKIGKQDSGAVVSKKSQIDISSEGNWFQLQKYRIVLPDFHCSLRQTCGNIGRESPITDTDSPLNPIRFACAVAIYRMGNRSGAKIRKKWEKMENGPRPEMAEKWPPKWKNGPKMGFWPFFLYFFHFGGHFSAISGRGPFSIFFPFFSDFCTGPVSHSVDGHRARKNRLDESILHVSCCTFVLLLKIFYLFLPLPTPSKPPTKDRACAEQGVWSPNPLSCRARPQTHAEEAYYRKRAEYGFGEYGFKHRTQWVFLALTEFHGANSVSSSQPIICVPKRTHRVLLGTHQVCPKTQWGSVSSFLRNSTLETVFRPFPILATKGGLDHAD